MSEHGAAAAAERFVTAYDGVKAYGLRNDAVEIVVVPVVGAKVVSLRNRRSGREWMWSPPDHRALRVMRVGSAFDTSSLVGADECLPTIAPCTWRGRALPDHGEVWAIAWTLHEPDWEQGKLTTGIRLPITDFWFERTIRLDGATVIFDYRLRNDDVPPQEFMWAFHPLLRIEEGDRLELPATVTGLRLESAMNLEMGAPGARLAWPEPVPGVRLDRLDLGGEAAIKLFSEPKEVGTARLYNEQTGDELRFTLDPRKTDTLGIWLTRGGWNGYHHLAIEPGIGAPDALDEAVQGWRRFELAMPNAILRWQFRVSVNSPA